MLQFLNRTICPPRQVCRDTFFHAINMDVLVIPTLTVICLASVSLFLVDSHSLSHEQGLPGAHGKKTPRAPVSVPVLLAALSSGGSESVSKWANARLLWLGLGLLLTWNSQLITRQHQLLRSVFLLACDFLQMSLLFLDCFLTTALFISIFFLLRGRSVRILLSRASLTDI